MLCVSRILGYIVSRSSHQRICLFTRCSSTIIQEKNIGLKSDPFQLEINLNNDDLDSTFLGVQDVPSLLQTATSKSDVSYAFKALDLLADWSKIKYINFEEVERDENYRKFLEVLEKHANKKPSVQIIGALKTLREMGVPSTNFLVESLENDLLWKMGKESVHSILLTIAFQIQYQEAERQRTILKLALEAVERRWTEVKFRDFSIIYNLSNHFSHDFLSIIDNVVIEEAESKCLNDLSKMMIAISVSKRRPTPVLFSLAFHMFKKKETLSPSQISSVIYAMNSLNFSDEALLMKLSTDFLAQIETVHHPSIIGTLLRCMGQMKWRNEALIDALGNWMLGNIKICRRMDLTTLIVTLASVSYTPDNIDELLDVCLSGLDPNTVEKSAWVDIVWSLVVLEKASEDHISSVLDPSFTKDIPFDNPTYTGMYLKLLNINAVAKTCLKSYRGPELRLPSMDNLLITSSRKDLSLHKYVQKVLQNFLPPPKYLRENVRTDMGFRVHAELIMDKNFNPLNLPEYSTAFEYSESLKPLPEGARRIALMVWNFRDLTIGSQSLTGQNSLAVKLIRKRGYTVVQIFYFDVKKKAKIIESVQSFERKIKEAVRSQEL